VDNQPLVSVGIPTYNRPDGLRRTLEHITAQTYKNLEIIISDNCSPGDEVEKVIHEFSSVDPRIQYHRQPENIGLSRNFGFVLRQAVGEYFMWAADDDEWDPSYIEICLGLFDKDTSLVCSQVGVHYRKTGLKVAMRMPDIRDGMPCYERMRAFIQRFNSSMIYGLHHRETLIKTFNFNGFFDWYDCALIIDYLSFSTVKICPQPIYTMGVDDEDYIFKPMEPSTNHLFCYSPLLKSSFIAIAKSDTRLWQKINLFLECSRVIAGLYLEYEEDYTEKSFANKVRYQIIYGFQNFHGVIITIVRDRLYNYKRNFDRSKK